MRIAKILVFLVLATTATIGLAQDVKKDYDRRANFSNYHTFMWIKEPKPTNPLFKDRIMDAVNAQLEAKGLRLVTGHADLGVSANTATKEQRTLTSFYDTFPGGWGWHRHWGGPVTAVVETYEVGTLVVDLFDTETKQVVWWGAASDTISNKPEKNEKHLNEAVEKMFKDFPPKSERLSN